jgi:hypothetical protein
MQSTKVTILLVRFFGTGLGVQCSERLHLGELLELLEEGLEKNPFFFKASPVGSLDFLYIFPEERVFRVFSVSRILFGASRL